MIQIKSVLIADEIEDECIDVLTQHGIKVDKKTKQTEDQLCVLLKNYDAVIVRSATKVNIFKHYTQLNTHLKSSQNKDN